MLKPLQKNQCASSVKEMANVFIKTLEDVYVVDIQVFTFPVTVFPVKTIHFNSVDRRVKQETTVPRILAGQELRNSEHLGI